MSPRRRKKADPLADAVHRGAPQLELLEPLTPPAQGVLAFRPPPQPSREGRASALAIPLRVSEERAASGLGGRTVEVYSGNLSSVDPMVSRQYVQLLVAWAVVHPLVSQAVKLIVANANQGHSVVVAVPEGHDGLTARFEVALAQFADRVNPLGGDLDALINTLVAQIVVTGALSSEIVLSADRRRVDQLALVPTQDVEFRHDGRWRAHQRGSRGLIAMDPRTYQYAALQTLEGNPYAIPPFAPAINAILREKDMFTQLDQTLRKNGWLGVLTLTVPDPYKDRVDLDDDARLRSYEDYMAAVLANVGPSMRAGLTGMRDGMAIQYQAAPVTSLTGLRELLELNEAQIFSGLGLDPSLFGRSWAKTETWLGVARSLLDATAEAIQRMVGAWIVRALSMDLMLQDIPVGAPYLEFSPVPRMRPHEEAAAKHQEFVTQKDKAASGLVEPDTAAQEMGYESWADPAKLFAQAQAQVSPFGFRAPGLRRFRFSRARGRHEFVRPSITVASRPIVYGIVDALTGLPLTVGAKRLDAPTHSCRTVRLARGPADPVLRRLVARFMARYAGRIAPVADEIQSGVMSDLRAAITAAPDGTWANEDEFARWALDEMQRSFGDRFDKSADPLLAKVLESHEEMNAAWRAEDTSVWRGDEPPEAVRRGSKAQDEAVQAMTRGDVFHVSVYLEKLQGDERKAMETMLAQEFVESGKDVTDPDVLDEMLNRMERSGGLLMRRRDHGREGGEASETDEEALARMGDRLHRIVATSTMRSQATAAVLGMEDAGIDEFEIVADSNQYRNDATEICTVMNGRRFKVAREAADLRAFHAMDPAEQEAELTRRRNEPPERQPGTPPFHPWCACSCEAVF